MADTWDEAACRARLAGREKLAEVSPMAFEMPVWSDLRAAMAALDAVRVKCERLRAALAEVDRLRERLEECRLTEVDDPVNDPEGELVPCPYCGGSGLAKDCTFW